MQKDLVTHFKSLFGQHGHRISQMCGIDRLSRLTEKLLNCIRLVLIGFYGISVCAINAVCDSYYEKIVHGDNLLFMRVR